MPLGPESKAGFPEARLILPLAVIDTVPPPGPKVNPLTMSMAPLNTEPNKPVALELTADALDVTKTEAARATVAINVRAFTIWADPGDVSQTEKAIFMPAV